MKYVLIVVALFTASTTYAQDCTSKLPEKETKVADITAALKCLAAENADLRKQIAAKDLELRQSIEKQYVKVGQKIQLKGVNGYVVAAYHKRPEVQVTVGSATSEHTVFEVEAAPPKR